MGTEGALLTQAEKAQGELQEGNPMGFVRKATIIGSVGVARGAGVKGKSKKERNAEANEKMAKIEGKRFKAEQKAAKEERKAARAEQRAAKAQTVTVQSADVRTAPAVQVTPAPSPPTPAQGPPAGWYLDPDGLDVQRWWDGTKWSDVTQAIPVSAGGPPSAMESLNNRLELLQLLHEALRLKIVASSEWITATPETLVQSEDEYVGLSTADAISQGDLADDGTGEDESAEPAPNETEQSEGDAQPLQFGQVVCDDETVTFVTRLWGQNNTNQVKMAKMGRKPVKIKQGKSGMLDMTVAPGVLAMKGLTVEQCTANLIEIAAFRPEASVDVPSTEVAEALMAGGVTIAIQVVP
jgi:hypothetical protein